jgi:hypothetical protein
LAYISVIVERIMKKESELKLSGNPILPGIGLCDPHVRIFNDRAYLYATHDRAEDSSSFLMDDWWIWSSSDLVNWIQESIILPENTYYGKPYSSCWAGDAIGKGKTDDKPYLHKRDGIYYLSWGCFYGMSDNIYGPYDCHGSIIMEENIVPSLRYKKHNITHDRHGSFFEWRNQWYFICNEMGKTQNMYFRDSSISYVNYRPNGEIEPVKISEEGVSLREE